MCDDDFIEKPSCKVLYRQSSVETRLSPVHLSDESNSESSDEETNTHPKIVNYQIKSENSEQTASEEKIKFQEELQAKLSKPLPINKAKYKTDDSNQYQQSKKTEDMKIYSKGINLAFKDELKTKLENEQGKSKVQERPIVQKPVVPRKPKHDAQEKIIIEDNRVPVEAAEGHVFSSSLEEEILNASKNIRKISLEKKLSVEEMSLVGHLKALNITKKDGQNENTVGESYCSKKDEMATARPKSPRPVAMKGEKDESIWDKLGTLGRKKRIKEVQEVQAEGKYAIDSPGCPTAPIVPPEEYNLDDNEERCIIEPKAYDDPKFRELLNVLKEWVNDELASQRIIVQDLSEDLYDGQVLQKLLEKLTGDKLDVPEVTQSEEGQKQKLSVVLGHFNQVLGIQRITHNKWSVEAIHSKNIVAITHLLVSLARHFRPPVRLPEHVSVDVVIVQKIKGVLNHKIVRESLTKAYDDVGMRCERDAFDTLFDHAPDKLQVVKKSLVTFVNKHLNKMNFEVTEIESQFHDGVYLIMLMGLLEGFFVPHYSFHLTPHEFDQKVHNVNFAFELMEEVGLQKPKARPEDVVNMDLKSTLRVLYNLFLKYKTIL